MSQLGLKLAGTQQASTVSTLHGYKVEEMSRSGMARAFMAAPRVGADGRIDMREVSDHGQLRLCETINPSEIITMGDEIFGSQITDLFFLDREPSRDRIAFSYELADGRFGTAVATLVA